jgi:hypothetical protein
MFVPFGLFKICLLVFVDVCDNTREMPNIISHTKWFEINELQE